MGLPARQHATHPASDPAPTKSAAAVPHARSAVENLTSRDPATTKAATARENTRETARELARGLFGRGRDREANHGRWRRLIAEDTFRHDPDRSPARQAEQSYRWLRLLNDRLEDPRALAANADQLTGLHEWAAIVEGGGGLCTVASIHYNLFLGSLLDHDADSRRDLSEFTEMRRIGTFLSTELDHGNDGWALETTAQLDRGTGEFVLHTPHPGARKFMPNTSTTGGPKSGLVAARLLVDGQDHGVYLFLTPLTDEHGPRPGVHLERLPLRPGAPVDHCLTGFEHVRLPPEALLQGEHGRLDGESTLTSSLGNRRKRFLRSIGRVTVGKLCMSAAAVGASRAALAIAVAHGQRRRITGPRPDELVPLNAHRSHHGRLLSCLATAYAMTYLHRQVLARYTAHTDATREDAERLVAIAKGWITWQSRAIATECRERCGAQGLFPANHLVGFAPYIEGTITAEGDNLVIWVKAAAELLFDHEPAGPASTTATAAPGTPEDLGDPYALRRLLAHAEGIWRARARTALRQGPAKNPLARWNKASPAALKMVSLHAALQAADAFIHAVETTDDPAAQQLLSRLCALFLLDQLSPHTGDLLANGHCTPDHVHHLPTTQDALLDALEPHITTLTDAFDLPHHYLAGIPLTAPALIPHQHDD
ncbi:acyl-CoA dehydrogenase [Streptomyces sp. NPDC048362]|uniref:acyl-CoA dehydrogenase n=1 Tax=Streptomyces sp. NPDC048362 TaxID=3365539 RepID=UPI003715B512